MENPWPEEKNINKNIRNILNYKGTKLHCN